MKLSHAESGSGLTGAEVSLGSLFSRETHCPLPRFAARRRNARLSRGERGSALIITLWVAFGLVAIALYFGQSSSLDLKAADNRAAALEAEQAIEGAARYVMYLLANSSQPGVLPDVKTYQREAATVGEARFWFIGRDPRLTQVTTDLPYFALVDESSKVNLNTVTAAMLEQLPLMTPELSAAIVDWRDADGDLTEFGAEEETYLLRSPAYYCKNAPFESVDELRLVNGADAEILYGEDLNRNGVLDLNENDGNATLPVDDRNGRLDPGLVEYFTVHSKEALTTGNGTARINVRQNSGTNPELRTLLENTFGTGRAGEIRQRLTSRTDDVTSTLHFFLRSRMTVDEFMQIEGSIYSAARNAAPEGRVNVNTASEQVLACIPGIGPNLAPSFIAYRQANPDRLNTVAWVGEIMGERDAVAVGQYLTGRSYQFSADIAAVGHMGRGYRRTRFVFDLSTGVPRIIYRQDLSDLGWALGRQTWQQQQQQQQQLSMNTR